MTRVLMAGVFLLGVFVLIGQFAFPASAPDWSPELGIDPGHVQKLGGWIYLGWGGLVWLVAIPVIVDAVRLVKRDDLARLQRATMIIKLAGIPFFVLNFLLLTTVVWATAFFGVGFVLAPLAVAGTYLVMLPTSIYGFACLALMRRKRGIDGVFFGINVVLHLMFVLDIVSTFVVAHRARAMLAPPRRLPPGPGPPGPVPPGPVPPGPVPPGPVPGWSSPTS